MEEVLSILRSAQTFKISYACYYNIGELEFSY